MVVIFFNVGMVLLVLLLLLLVFVNSSAELILSVLGIVCVAFLIKNLLQDIYFGLIKYHHGLGITLIGLISDIARVLFFYKLISYFATGVAKGTGLGLFGWMLAYVISILVGGFLFIGAEAGAMAYGTDNAEIGTFISSIFLTVVLVVFYYIMK